MKFENIRMEKNNSYLVDKYLKEGKHMFVLVYMEGCGPCNMTRPEWAKIEGRLKSKYSSNDDVVILDIDQELLPNINSIQGILGFPTMRYMNGTTVEEYNNNRDVDSFVLWIDSKMNKINKKSKSNYKLTKKISPEDSIMIYRKKYNTRKHKSHENKLRKNKMKGGKWSAKYKKSINCKKPKGFSQRQYCKYGRKTRKNI
jgi:thiol-disulfide isomerase/thioredoxin